MKNYSRKKSTPSKVAFTSSSQVRGVGQAKIKNIKTTCCRSGLKGKCAC